MQVVEQILSERPGRSEKKEYEISDLQDVIEGPPTTRKHVTLYPGDYTGITNQIEIPTFVSVTLLPGAIVDYAQDFRLEGFNSYDGDVQEAEDGSGTLLHPLSDGTAARYVAPDFTGHVENIADLNLASDWAFKGEFERSIWSVQGPTTLEDIPFDGVFELREGTQVDITVGARTNPSDGAFAEISHASISTTSNISNSGQDVIQSIAVDNGHVIDATTTTAVPNVLAGDILTKTTDATTGEITVDHLAFAISGDPVNSGTTVLQSVSPYNDPGGAPDSGHIEGAGAADIVGGTNIQVQDTGQVNGKTQIEVGTEFFEVTGTAPTDDTVGSEGDLWLVV